MTAIRAVRSRWLRRLVPALHLLPLLIRSEAEHPRGRATRREGGREGHRKAGWGGPGLSRSIWELRKT